jgi:hypothetical protein
MRRPGSAGLSIVFWLVAPQPLLITIHHKIKDKAKTTMTIDENLIFLLSGAVECGFGAISIALIKDEGSFMRSIGKALVSG